MNDDLNDQRTKIILLELTACIFIAISLDKRLSFENLQEDKYAQYSMFLGGLLGFIISGIVIINARKNIDNTDNGFQEYDFVQAAIIPIFSILVSQALRYIIPCAIKSSYDSFNYTKNLMFSNGKRVEQDNAGVNQSLLDEELPRHYIAGPDMPPLRFP